MTRARTRAPRRTAVSSSSRRRNPAPSPSERPSRAASKGRAAEGLRARRESKPENTNGDSASAPPARTRSARPSRIQPAARPIAAAPEAHAVETVATGPLTPCLRARSAASAPGKRARKSRSPRLETRPPGLDARERRADGDSRVRAAGSLEGRGGERLGGRGEREPLGAIPGLPERIGGDLADLGGRLRGEAGHVEGRHARDRGRAAPGALPQDSRARAERGDRPDARDGHAPPAHPLAAHVLLIIPRRAASVARAPVKTRPALP